MSVQQQKSQEHVCAKQTLTENCAW